MRAESWVLLICITILNFLRPQKETYLRIILEYLNASIVRAIFGCILLSFKVIMKFK